MNSIASKWGVILLTATIWSGTVAAQPPGGGRGGPPGAGGRRGGPPATSPLEQAVNSLGLANAKEADVISAVRAHDQNVRALTELANSELIMKMKEVVPAADFKKLTDNVAALRAAPRGGGPEVTEDDLVSRVLAFAKSGSGRVMKDDLPERMQSLVAEGDRNGDQALDRAELELMATDRPTATAGRRGGRGGGGNAGLAAPTPPLPAAAISRAVDSLNLTGTAKESAAALVRTEQETVQRLTAMARSDLLLRVHGVLDETELKNFTALVDRTDQLTPPRRGGQGPNDAPPGARRGRGGNRGGG